MIFNGKFIKNIVIQLKCLEGKGNSKNSFLFIPIDIKHHKLLCRDFIKTYNGIKELLFQ